MTKPSGEVKVLAKGRHLQLVSRDGWEFAERPNVTGIVIIVAVTPEDNVILVEQNRPPVGGRVIELPAGLAGDVAGSEAEALRGSRKAGTPGRDRLQGGIIHQTV